MSCCAVLCKLHSEAYLTALLKVRHRTPLPYCKALLPGYEAGASHLFPLHEGASLCTKAELSSHPAVR